MTSCRLSAFLSVAVAMPGPLTALLVKGSFATGLAGQGSDLDLWVVIERYCSSLEPVEVSQAHDLRALIYPYLQASLPQAFELDPPVELDITTRASFSRLYAFALQLVAAEPQMNWDGIETVHELASSRRVYGEIASIAATSLPTGRALARFVSSRCRAVACRTFGKAAVLLQVPDRPAGVAEGVLATAVSQLCSALLAAHGYDNPKAKWRLPQARLLGGTPGSAIESALECADARQDAADLCAWFSALSRLLP
jgi:hypothetical protein